MIIPSTNLRQQSSMHLAVSTFWSYFARRPPPPALPRILAAARRYARALARSLLRRRALSMSAVWFSVAHTLLAVIVRKNRKMRG